MTTKSPTALAIRDALREMWVSAGRPSSRHVAHLAAVSHTTVAQALLGDVRSWRALSAIVTALGAEPQDFADLWRAHIDAGAPERVGPRLLPKRPEPTMAEAVALLAEAVNCLADAIARASDQP